MRSSPWCRSFKLTSRFLLYIILSLPASAWPQSVQELSLLTLDELRWEAVNRCVEAVVSSRNIYGTHTQRIVASDMLIVALKRLERIYLVARQKNGGEFPAWVDRARKLSSETDFNKCKEI